MLAVYFCRNHVIKNLVQVEFYLSYLKWDQSCESQANSSFDPPDKVEDQF